MDSSGVRQRFEIQSKTPIISMQIRGSIDRNQSGLNLYRSTNKCKRDLARTSRHIKKLIRFHPQSHLESPRNCADKSIQMIGILELIQPDLNLYRSTCQFLGFSGSMWKIGHATQGIRDWHAIPKKIDFNFPCDTKIKGQPIRPRAPSLVFVRAPARRLMIPWFTVND